MSTVPAELILLQGAPNYQLVTGTENLLWVSNTESDVFRMGKAGPVYFLVAGRWFSSPGLDGPWTFATPNMPAAFKQIPLEHPRSRVLAAVPGTDQAAEAVLLASIPQTARVSRKDVKAPEVAFEGDPKFEPIPSTSVARAVNTDKDIIKVGDLYYLCFDGVWFVSKAPTGPWTVADSIPKTVYEIPVSSPAHSVTYVTVEDSNDEWVTFAAAAAFTGVMIAWGCAVWGTGYHYPPYWGWHGAYPYYYPHYPSYGYGASYNPWTGAYGRGVVAYGPYGGAGVGARYNPRTGTYARGAVAYGPYGARGAAQAYNPRTGTYAQTRQGASAYGSWGTTGVQRGDDWARTSRVTSNVTGNTTRVSQGSGGGESISRNQAGAGGRTTVARSGSGDVYAGHDGNVYKNDGGSWQKYENGDWSSVQQPTQAQKDQARSTAQDRAGQTAGASQTAARTGQAAGSSPTVSQLNSDRAARAEGAARTGAYSGYQRGTIQRAAAIVAAAPRAAGPAAARAAAEPPQRSNRCGRMPRGQQTNRRGEAHGQPSTAAERACRSRPGSSTSRSRSASTTPVKPASPGRSGGRTSASGSGARCARTTARTATPGTTSPTISPARGLTGGAKTASAGSPTTGSASASRWPCGTGAIPSSRNGCSASRTARGTTART